MTINVPFPFYRGWMAPAAACVVLALGYVGWSRFGPAEARLIGTDFFLQPPGQLLRIRIAPENLERLRASPREWVRGEVRWADHPWTEVRLRLKGHGSFQDIDAKPNLTLDFERDGEDPSLPEIGRLHLNNSAEDESYMNEMIAGGLFDRAGVPSPRVTHAVVRLNGRRLGLYVVKEGFGPSFLSRHFGSSSGALLEPAPGHDVDGIMRRQSGEDSPELCALMNALQTAVNEPDGRARLDQLRRILAWDAFVSLVAVEIITVHWDGYAIGKNNFRLHHDPARQRLVFLPAGLDQLFGNDRFPVRPEMAGRVARAIMEIPDGSREIEARVRLLADQGLNSDEIDRRIRDRVDQLRPHLGRAEWRALQHEADERSRGVAARAEFLRRELKILPEGVKRQRSLSFER